MERTGSKLYFEFGSEDSDSSSSSEKQEKRALLTRQVCSEIVKPSTIEISDDDFKVLIRRMEAVCKSSPKISFSEEIKVRIQQFLTTVTQRALFFSHQDDKLNTDFKINNLPENLIYFVKVSSDENCVDFYKLLIFGSIDHEVNNSLILVLKMVYLVIVYNMSSLPYRIKRRITKSMEEFLLYLTTKHSKNFGISEIYIPALCFFDYSSIHQFTCVDDLINFLEGIVVHWCDIMSDAIHDDEINLESIKDFNAATLFQFWEYKLFNLEWISKCLSDEHSKKIINILEEHNSVHLKLLFELKIHLNLKIIDSKSILDHLTVFKKANEKLETVDIDDIPHLLPDLFQVVMNITSSSSHFQSWDNMSHLLIGIGKHVISICQKNIKIEEVLDGNTKQCMSDTMKSIKTCQLYLGSLQNDILENTFWKQYSQNVCSPIEAYIQRCRDILNLCSLINIFSSSQNDGKGIRIMIEYNIRVEERLKMIHEHFLSSLNYYRRIQDNILYIQSTDWFTANEHFREEIRKIETEIKEFANSSFAYVTTVEDELNVLRVLYNYSKLNSMKSFFINKNNELIHKFVEEMQDIKEEALTKNNITSLVMNLSLLDLASSTFLKKRRLHFLYKLLNDSNWLMNKESLERAKFDFNDCIIILNKLILNNYKYWLEQVNPAILSQLKRPLVCKCFYKTGLLEVNIDRKLLKVIRESHEWIQMGFKLPTYLETVWNVLMQVLVLYGNVEELVINYNRIISSLTVGEHVLFSEIMNFCTETISPTLYTMLWDYEQCNHIVLEYLKQINLVESMVKNYKNSNNKIIETCKLICCVNFLQISKTKMEDIEQEIIRNRLVCLKKLINHYNTIASCVQTVFDGFGHYIHKMKDIWNIYVEKIDILLESALHKCIKNSLANLYYNFTSTADPDHNNPINIIISVVVENGKILFHPSLDGILAIFSQVNMIILEAVKIIPRLFNKFKMTKSKKKISYAKQIAKEDDVLILQNQINSVLLENMIQVKNHLKLWNQHRVLWKIDAEKFSIQYINFSSAHSYSSDFVMYTFLIKEIRNSNHVDQLSLFNVNTEKLASEVITQCDNRINNLSFVLRMKLMNWLENIQIYINEKILKLNEVLKKQEYLDCIKDLFLQSKQKEMEIMEIKDYVHILRQFKLQHDLELKLEIIQKNWNQYLNALERNKLKAKIMYNTTI